MTFQWSCPDDVINLWLISLNESFMTEAEPDLYLQIIVSRLKDHPHDVDLY